MLQNLVLVAMTFVIFWITLFPLISQAITGTKVSVGPPAFTPFVVPLALILVLLAGVGPLISWRRATVANLRRHFIFPVAFGVVVTILVLVSHRRGPQAARGRDVRARRVRDRHGRAGVLPRHRRPPRDHRGRVAGRPVRVGSAQPPPLRRLHRSPRVRGDADRGRGLIVVPALAQRHTRPGQSVSNDGYVFHYVRPTAVATSERVSFGAIINVTKRGKQVTRLHTMQSFYPSTNGADGFIGRFFDIDNADSTIGLDSGPLRDIWTVAAANLTALEPLDQQGRQRVRRPLQLGAQG